MIYNYKFVFVILHYNTIEDTESCVSSIFKNITESNFAIVVVDNKSPNNSGIVLKKKYKKCEKVHVILSDENLGFAKGNNLGFDFAKKNLNADFIIFMNNDTKLLNNDFCNIVVAEYESSKCALIGPKVITPHPPYDSNPGQHGVPSLIQYLRQQIILYLYWLLSYFYLDSVVQSKIGKTESNRQKKDVGYIEKRTENVQLHGCLWIFTPVYVKMFDGIDCRTFLYNEEPILYIRCLRNQLKTVYNPLIEIFHKEDSSTNSISFKGAVYRRRFLYKNLTRSGWILITEILKYHLCLNKNHKKWI